MDVDAGRPETAAALPGAVVRADGAEESIAKGATVADKVYQEQVAQSIPESWETAYIFAFVHRFTDICSNIETALHLQTAMDLEKAIEEPGTSSDPHPALAAIFAVFRRNLRNADSRTTAKDWMSVWVREVLGTEGKHPSTREVLRWNTNKLAEGQDGFFGLHWRDKLHLLRTMVDHQLAHSPAVKDLVNKSYDVGRDRPGKARTTDENPLIVESLGLDRDIKTWWHIDDSPRLYSSGNPYKSTCSWQVLSSNRDEYSSVVDTLAKPEASAESGLAPIFQQKAKKSGREVFERELRKRIESTVTPRLDTGEARLADLQHRKDLADLSEQRKQQRLAQAQAQEIVAQEQRASRSTRLRAQTKRVDYALDGLTDQQWEKAIDKMDRGEDIDVPEPGSSSRRGKRRRYEDDSEDFEVGTDEDDEVTARPKRSTRAKDKAPAKPEWRGERRSTRVRKPIVEPEEESSEEEVIRPSVAWSRSRKPSEPEAPRPEESAGNVSVWSRGKLVFVNGNNRYSGKAIAAPTKRKIVANASGGSVIKGDEKETNGAAADNTPSARPPASAGFPSASSNKSFADLQARLAAVQGAADDSSSDDGARPEGVFSTTSASTTAPTNTISNGRTESSPLEHD